MPTDIVFKDHFSGHAAQYAAARPQYPSELFEFVIAQCAQKSLAWDCAAGNGRCHNDNGFHRIAMLAEQVALQSCSVDLVIVAQALHWFDSKRFFAEVDRVLKPGGVLAVWCYGIQHIDASLDPVIGEFYNGILGPYWPDERRMVEAGYQSIEFPYQELCCPTFKMQKHWSLEELLAYFASWSAVQRYRQAVGKDPLELVKSELQDAWSRSEAISGDGALTMQKVISWPLSLRVTVKPA